jgi:hypothetical protein
VRAESQGEGFGPASKGGLSAHDVGEFVDGEGRGYEGGFVGVVAGEGVEAICSDDVSLPRIVPYMSK